MSKSLTILGSTGSIGCSTLDLVRDHLGAFDLVAISANTNVGKLIEQARQFRPQIAVIGDESLLAELRDGLSGTGIEVAAGAEAIIDAAAMKSDFVMAGIVGAAGMRPTMAAVERGATLGLANKECLVCAGQIMMKEVERCGATLLPVDSEHNAIFQVFDGDRAHHVRRIILTASGGPFRTMTREEMQHATPAQAVAHPNWDMGAKISVDSATMMNKGLELIEAYHLFPLEQDQFEVLVHPQSTVHGLVEYDDGSVLAQMGSPDMRTPIAYCLAWPERMDAPVERLDLAALGRLDFSAPDNARFPAIQLCRDALKEGGSAPIVLNAANEMAVAAFLSEKIEFGAISALVGTVLEKNTDPAPQSLDDVDAIDQKARTVTATVIESLH